VETYQKIVALSVAAAIANDKVGIAEAREDVDLSPNGRVVLALDLNNLDGVEFVVFLTSTFADHAE